MARFDVVVTAPALAPEAVALLHAAGAVLHYTGAYPSEPAVAERVAAVDAGAILSRQARVGATAMDAAPGLRIVARHGVGVDDVDLEAARARGVAVTRAPGSNTRAVAEHTLALMLALLKDLRPLGASVAAGGWRAGAVRDVAGRRLGLVGHGAIGRAVATLAGVFGMEIAVHDPADPGGLPLEQLLARSDVLSLHCPLLPQTRHMIDAAALARLPPGGFVINTARGGLIDEAALLAALDSGRLAGAALDVFATEPPDRGDALRNHPRVLVTPHVAGVTPSSMTTMGVMAAECIVAVLTGAPLPAERVVVEGRR